MLHGGAEIARKYVGNLREENYGLTAKSAIKPTKIRRNLSKLKKKYIC